MSDSNYTIGIFAGSFNPAHKAHFEMKDHYLWNYRPDEFWWAISVNNADPNKGFLQRNNRHHQFAEAYYYDYIPLFKNKYRDVITNAGECNVDFLVGVDTWNRINAEYEHWMKYCQARFIVFPRDNVEPADSILTWNYQYDFKPMNISSTEIRNGKQYSASNR